MPPGCRARCRTLRNVGASRPTAGRRPPTTPGSRSRVYRAEKRVARFDAASASPSTWRNPPTASLSRPNARTTSMPRRLSRRRAVSAPIAMRRVARTGGLAPARAQQRDHQRRRDQACHQGEGRAEDEHPDREGQEAHQVRHENGDAGREHGVHGFDVRRAATDEIAHRCPVEVAHGEPLNMRNEADAQTAEHALGDRRGEVAVEERHRLDGGAGSEIEDREQEQAGRPADEQMVVDDRANDERGASSNDAAASTTRRRRWPRSPGLQQVRQIRGAREAPGARLSP